MADTTHDAYRPDAADGRPGWRGIAADWSSDQRAFKNVSWGKAMMWIFLLSDTFIFSCFLLSYMTVRMSTTVPWPNPSEVFALHIGGAGHSADPDRHHDLRADHVAAAPWRWRSISATAATAGRPRS